MKKFLMLIGLLTTASAWAGDKEVLQERLAKIDGFYARFS